jgi:hypothetical protein
LRHALADVSSESDVRTVLMERFELIPIAADHAFTTGERFVIFASGLGHVVEVDQPPMEQNAVRVITWLDRKRMLPIPLDKLLKSIAKERVLSVRPKQVHLLASATIHQEHDAERDAAERDRILDMGAFTQLLDAAQRSGILPSSGMIIQVRDCEYRLGRYNKGLQMMETLFTSFVGAEIQRHQRLQREEIEIASGRKKMSLNELQAKRIKDNQDSQSIDRAKVRFQRVLEGMRGLLPLERSEGL